MTVAIGDALPEALFFKMGSDGPVAFESRGYFARRKIVLFSSPGAFTPTDTQVQLPGYIALHEQFRARGVDAIACTAVNDVFVMDAWRHAVAGEDRIDMLADSSGAFTRDIGLDQSISNYELGRRAMRYAMIVDNGIILGLGVEAGLKDTGRSSAEAMLALL
ncbi:redoxin family protein [Sphingopyxis sp. LARHCG72]